jgi:hypothetical protein
MSEERLIAIETKLDVLAAGQEALARDLRSEMKDLGDGLQGQISDMGNQMRVLHEDTIANIKALAPDFEPIRREYREADAKLKEEILGQLARGRRAE